MRERPDAVIVVGDVNSTLACGLVTAKIAFDAAGRRPLIAHVEAGLRSFDRTMPEECNRILTDHLSDLLFVTEPSGVRNLKKEGISSHKVHFVGNTMIDSLLAYQGKAENSSILAKLGFRQVGSQNGSVAPYALLTLHRPSNVDVLGTFQEILEGLSELAHQCPVVFPAHPRTQKRIAEFGLEHYFHLADLPNSGAQLNSMPKGINVLSPLGYFDFLCLMKHARLVVTDSGGIQEETTCLGVPCVTVRENTERPVTSTWGTNILGGTHSRKIRKAILEQMRKKPRGKVPETWDGKAASRILTVMLRQI